MTSPARGCQWNCRSPLRLLSLLHPPSRAPVSLAALQAFLSLGPAAARLHGFLTPHVHSLFARSPFGEKRNGTLERCRGWGLRLKQNVIPQLHTPHRDHQCSHHVPSPWPRSVFLRNPFCMDPLQTAPTVVVAVRRISCAVSLQSRCSSWADIRRSVHSLTTRF